MDFGKFKYEQQKKAHEARKNHKIIEIKEIKLRPNINEHDYDVKIRAAKRFLEDEDKVKFTMRFRGREMSHSEIGLEMMKKITVDLEECGKIETNARLEGKQLLMILAPR
jgi:translation initiation factor IF-3